MSKYVDVNYNYYNSILELLEHKNDGCKFDIKQLLLKKIRLLIINKDSAEIVEIIDDIQPLYLYPLSILDYSKSLLEKNRCLFSSIKKISMINFYDKINYIEKLSKSNLKNLSNIEIEITDKYNEKELNKIIDLVKYLSLNSLKITLIFKSLNISNQILIKLSLSCDFFKIIMPNILNTSIFEQFKNKLQIISLNKKEESVVLIKSYISIEQNEFYENAITTFSKLNVDIFQLSKELMPLNVTENPLISKEIQNNIRYLEKKYNSFHNTKFISVKDISTLYYPRFELDERNSKNCYTSIMKPYLYKSKFLPCKVEKVIKNIDEWYVADIEGKINNKNLQKCGNKCDDCASIFENDILNRIEMFLEEHENVDFAIEIMEEQC